MNNLPLRTGLKYGLILAAINLLLGFVSTFAYSSPSSSEAITILAGILSNVLLMVFICMAHYQFNQKNGGYISFQDAFLIGAMIVLIHFVITSAFQYISFELVLREKMEAEYSRAMGAYGLEIKEQILSRRAMLLSAAIGLFMQLLILFLVLTLEGQWKIFKKAGKPGWACLVPIYNIITFLEVARKPTWWVILLLIPVVNIVFAILMLGGLSRQFGKSAGFTLGLLFLPFIFYPLLGMSKAEYLEEE